jgi:hypothetical protein
MPMPMTRRGAEQPSCPRANTNPKVGIFWFVLDDMGGRHMLADGCDLAEAEPYGDCLTFGPGHSEIWNKWRRSGPPSNRALMTIIRDDEYEDWPRGRIVFDRIADRFMLYADRRITAEGLTAKVAQYFCLPADRTVIQYDLHYRSPRSIKARV